MTDHQGDSSREKPEFLTLISVISHLMTCYSLRPCPVLAQKVENHLRVLLHSECSEELKDWRGVFEQLHGQWVHLSYRSSMQRLVGPIETVPIGVTKH
ncbi:hypothetical protein [Methylohalobius crimeensis]|uniref:hypothetical protein n=1 Tax=Methylohalobius crimeensis TaxID=244365 RepID=UPI0003B67D6D|nr:hypothetical protein [Methylohalobius crimeensis]